MRAVAMVLTMVLFGAAVPRPASASGRVVGTRVASSPSALLNGSALAAARASTFQPAAHDCVPIASTYRFTVDFVSGSR